MENSPAVSAGLLAIVKELQGLESLCTFALAGGTSLALRFNHRYSDDIDLFTNQIIGVKGFTKMKAELEQFYGNALLGSEIINDESGDQYCFLRAFITRNGEAAIKIEIIQNMAFMYPMEMLGAVRIISLPDAAFFKLMSASGRKAKKDIYHLDLITEHLTLPDCWQG